MGLKCKVSYTDNNEAIVQDDFGRESVLYRGLLQVLGNQEAALTAWATAHTRDMNFIGESARPVDVIRFMDSYQAEISRPNEAEKFQIRDFQQKNGFHRLSDLYAEMVQIFKPNGYFEVDVQRAIESGMYTKENIEELDVQMVSDILSKIEGQLLVEDIYTVPDTLEDTYENDTEKTVFGTSRRYSEQDVFDSIRQTVSNPRYENGFYKEIGNTGFTKLEDRLKSDPKFAREFIDRMSVPQSVNTLRVDVDGNVVVGSNNTYDTVKNTVLRGTSTLELQADIDFIEGIEDNFWAVSLDKVQEVVRDIEEGLIKNNLDIIGLSTRTSNKAEILQVLEASLQLLENPNDTNVANFSELKDRIFGTEQINEIHNIPENFENRTTFYLDTEKGAAELFNDYGLIKIADNIYHKVDQNADVDLAIDIIAKSDLVIPKSNRTEGVSENKVDRVQDVTNYVMSTSPRSLEGINNPLLYAAYLNHFGHQPLEISKSDIANLSDIKTSTEYLEDQFVVDFYNEYLKHKFENSQEYQSTLSKFRFTNSDIIINSRISGIENLPMQQELADYIRLRNNESMKYLVEQTAEVNEDLAMINDTSSISEYQGPISVRGNYAFVNNNLSDNFVKVDGEVYRKVLAEENTSLFLKVIPNSSETYLDASTNFKHDKAEAQKMMDAYKTSSKTTVGSTEYKSKISRARTAKIRSAKLRELSTLTSPDYSFTVEGDGIIAYKDGKQVSRLTLGDYKKGKQVQDFEINQRDRGKGLETEMYLLMLDNFKRDTIYLGQTEFTAERYIAETLELPKVGTDFVYNSNEQLISTETLNTTNNEETGITELGEQGGDRRRWNPSRGNQTLEGAPVNTKRKNVTGADPELTYWAEEYAKRRGIDYKRQSKYVEVDVDRAMRIAEAYDAMEHAPQNPEVKEAYSNLIQQTLAQYEILVEGGYQFYFFDETNDPYNGNPFAAMEELRNNKRMGSFATEAGFGTGNEGLDVSDNPMLEDTGLVWGWGSIDGEPKRVLANDLFRAVHDAFGHGLEGAGFRARGEENAWQAHARLFTGSAVAAITSETRGQNSWLNFGKHGEHNRTAKVEDTVFAPQKTGLMPEWTWKEGFDEGVESMEAEMLGDTNGNVIGVKPEVLEEIRKEREQIETEARANGTWMKAPNGENTNLNEEQWVTVRTRRFKDWFGDWINDPENASKVVDENGEPMVMYHSTKSGEFFEFDPEKIGSGAGINYGSGFYFESRKDEAKWYTQGEGRVIEVFLNSRNPVNYYGATEVQKERADGVSDNLNGDDVFEGGQFMVKRPNQIKSATDNVGTFSSESNNINDQVPKAFNEGVEVVEKTATIFQNAIEVVPLYSTKDINTIEQEIDSCG